MLQSGLCFRETDSSVAATLLHEGCGFVLGGFPRSQRVKHDFARCTLSKIDVDIGQRGLVALHEHWKSQEH